MEHPTVDPLNAAQLTESERRVVERFVSWMDNELGDDLRGLWPQIGRKRLGRGNLIPETGSRARGTAHPGSDVDLLVIADGGRDRYGRIAGDLSEEAAITEGESPFNFSVQDRRAIESFSIQEVDRDKIVLAGSALD